MKTADEMSFRELVDFCVKHNLHKNLEKVLRERVEVCNTIKSLHSPQEQIRQDMNKMSEEERINWFLQWLERQ